MKELNKEIVIKKSRVDKILHIVFAIATMTFGLYLLCLKDFKRGMIMIIGGIVLYITWKIEYKKDRPILRINKKNIWVPENGRIAWTSIEKIKFNHDFSTQYMRRTVEIYKIGQTEPIEIIYIDSISIPRWRLKRILRQLTTIE